MRVAPAPMRMSAPPRMSAPAPRFVAPVRTFSAARVYRPVTPMYRPVAPRTFVARPAVVAQRVPASRAVVRAPVASTGTITNPGAINRAAIANRNLAAARRNRLPAVAEQVPTNARRAARAGAVAGARGARRAPVVASRDPDWHHWDHNRTHSWHHHHFRWFNNGWVLIDPWVYAYANDPYYYSDYNYGDYDYGYAPETTALATVSDTTSLIDSVQSQLAQAGYYNGSIDGLMGPATRSAISRYQSDNGLAVTGTITQGLLQSLGLS